MPAPPSEPTPEVSPRARANQLFHSERISPLTAYLEEWRAGTHNVNADYVVHVVNWYLTFLTGTPGTNLGDGADREAPPQ